MTDAHAASYHADVIRRFPNTCKYLEALYLAAREYVSSGQTGQSAEMIACEKLYPGESCAPYKQKAMQLCASGITHYFSHTDLQKLNEATRILSQQKDISLPDKLEVCVYHSDLINASILTKKKSPGRATLGITTAALESLDRDQLAVLVGHELRHLHRNNIRLSHPHHREYDADGVGGSANGRKSGAMIEVHARSYTTGRDLQAAMPEIRQYLQEKYQNDPDVDGVLDIVLRSCKPGRSVMTHSIKHPATINRIGYLMELEEYQKRKSESWLGFLKRKPSMPEGRGSSLWN